MWLSFTILNNEINTNKSSTIPITQVVIDDKNFFLQLYPSMENLYTQYPIIRNGLIRNGAEFWGKFKKRALGQSNLRNASKNLRNAQCSDFQI